MDETPSAYMSEELRALIDNPPDDDSDVRFEGLNCKLYEQRGHGSDFCHEFPIKSVEQSIGTDKFVWTTVVFVLQDIKVVIDIMKGLKPMVSLFLGNTELMSQSAQSKLIRVEERVRKHNEKARYDVSFSFR